MGEQSFEPVRFTPAFALVVALSVVLYGCARSGSPGLRVTPTTQSIMAVPTQGRARWDWQVSGIQAGPQVLTLSLFAVVDSAPNAPRILIQTFSRRLSVTVTAGYEAMQFLENNWKWLWSVIVVPVAAWLWRRRALRASTG